MEEEPYLIDRREDAGPPPGLDDARCPFAPDGTRAWALTPRGLADALRAAARLKARGDVQCLLLRPGAVGPWLPPDVGDLRRWAARAEEALGRPVRPLRKGCQCLCGDTPACRGHVGAAVAETALWMGDLADRQDSLSAAVDAAFAGLTERQRRLVQEWAHRHEPGKAGHAIRIKTLAREFGRSTRQVYRTLQRARETNPGVFATMLRLRTTRASQAKAWEVREVRGG